MRIHLLGDSIVKSYGDDAHNLIGGWGDHLGSFFKEDVEIFNYAQGGRSTRSFINEGRFIDKGCLSKDAEPKGLGPALPRIKEGDYVFLQFGHNDDFTGQEANHMERHTLLGMPGEEGIYPTIVPTEDMLRVIEDKPEYGGVFYSYDCGATYKGFLKYYIEQIRAKKAIPVLVTSVVRITFEGGNVIVPTKAHFGGKDAWHAFPYIEAARQVGRELQVPVLDLFAKTKKMQEMLGPEDSVYMHCIVELVDGVRKIIGDNTAGRPAVWPEEFNRRHSEKDMEGVDVTHQNRFGSFVYAGLIAEMLWEQKLLDTLLLKRPTKQVAAPDGLMNRLDDIKSQFNMVSIFKPQLEV